MVRPFFAVPLLAFLPPLLGQVQQLDPVTVSALRAPVALSQVPFTVDEIPGDAFSESPSPTVDDVLLSAPEFSLFRRNGSMSANPTAQGVSLRGLGPSGASRSLVLLDGIPLNDPFGGWIAWSMVPVDSVAGAEVVPGGGASAWGNASLAGVIELFSRSQAAGTGWASVQEGDFDSRSASLGAAVRLGGGTLSVLGESFATTGFGLVSDAERGPVDTDAGSRHSLAQARWSGSLAKATQATFTLRSYDEWRDNGTAYQQNRLRSVLASAQVSGSAAPDERWSATGYLQDQSASQTFSSVNAARSAETPASNQFAVPATALGVAAASTWGEPDRGQTTLGADLRDVRGETREDFSYAGGAYTQQRFAGGRQTFAGAFVERIQPLVGPVHGTVGLRLDRWEDSNGHLRTDTLATGALLTQAVYPTRAGTEFSPSAGLTWQATDSLEFHVAAQHAFRVPTLNELYRPFRQGSTVTLANPGLSTEHADSAEVGAAWQTGPLRATLEGFAARLDDPVSNVTLVQGPGTFPGFGTLPVGGVGQERLNLGRVDTHGVQAGVNWVYSASWTLTAGALGEDATVASAPVSPVLAGNRVPEVPRWSASIGATWRPSAHLYLTLRWRRSGSEYDDDRNQLPLAAATVADAYARLALSDACDLVLSIENLADARVQSAHSALGVFNVGPPRIASAGLRVRW